MLVKCHDLNGEKRERSECYKAPDKKYYSSEKAYKWIEKNKKYREMCWNKYKDWTEIGDDLEAPTMWKKIVKKYEKYSYMIVYETLVIVEDSVKWALEHKTFKNEMSQIQYINAIISNNINDVYRKVRNEKIQEKKVKEYAKEVKDEIKTRKIKQKQKVKDITQWL